MFLSFLSKYTTQKEWVDLYLKPPYIRAYTVIYCSGILFMKLIIAQIVNIGLLPALYGTQSVHYLSHKSPQVVPVLR
jgi:hypothetical protein